MATIEFSSKCPVSVEHLYQYHASGAAFQRLLPPWEDMTLEKWVGGEKTRHLPKEEQLGDISTGTVVHLRTKVGPFSFQLIAKHIAHEKPSGFTDEQIKGPFRSWSHKHSFLAEDEHSRLVDAIDYTPPFSFFSGGFVRQKIQRVFSFRHRRTIMDLQRHAPYADRPKKKIAISGASGLIGQHLCDFLQVGGHDIYKLVRRSPTSEKEIQWDLLNETVEHHKLEGMDAIIHLAGESIDGRWTKIKKARILQSRKKGTTLLSKTIAELSSPPNVFISASAVGAYGDQGNSVVSEDSPLADDFLGQVCQQWERATLPVQERGIRVVHPRIGLVLSAKGGALPKMLTPFSLGVGGQIGSGKQWMSWIALDDLLGLFLEMIHNEEYRGAVNAVSPGPVQNREFTKTLAKVLNRPAIFPVPSAAITLMFGEMGKTLLLQGAKVRPSRALQHNFQYGFPTLKEALQFELGKMEAEPSSG